MVHSNLGLVLHDMGKVTEALQSYEQAIALDPTNPQAQLNLGTAREDLRDLPGAIECYRRALELDDTFALAWQNLGQGAQSGRRRQCRPG